MTTSDEAPLAEFKDCHAGIVKNLDQLAELPALLAPAEVARKNAQSALAFFNKVLYDHHSDEEKDLFPMVELSCASEAERNKVRAITETLIKQHRELEELWGRLAVDLKKIALGKAHDLNLADLEKMVESYKDHASHEETAYLPLAKEILGRDDANRAALALSLHLHHVRTNIVGYI